MTAMTAVMTGAASDSEVIWHSIDWTRAHRTVRRLQVRIAKAVRERRWNKVKALQWLLTHSFCGKVIAVKRVTENRGKKTPGSMGQPGTHRRRKPKLSCRSGEEAINLNL